MILQGINNNLQCWQYTITNNNINDNCNGKNKKEQLKKEYYHFFCVACS